MAEKGREEEGSEEGVRRMTVSKFLIPYGNRELNSWLSSA